MVGDKAGMVKFCAARVAAAVLKPGFSDICQRGTFSWIFWIFPAFSKY
jgi:hypothetical protein